MHPTYGCIPEKFKKSFEVGNHLVLSEESIAINGLGVALDAEVASQLYIETNLQGMGRFEESMQAGVGGPAATSNPEHGQVTFQRRNGNEEDNGHLTIDTCCQHAYCHSLQRRIPHLLCLRVLDGLEPDIIDEDMGKIIPRWRQRKVDLSGQVRQLIITLAVVGDHVVDLCSGSRHHSKNGGTTSSISSIPPDSP